MKAIYRITLVLAALTLGVSAMAQNLIRGNVTDSEGLPLPGAGVIIQGTTTGAMTDDKGQFELKAKPGDILEVSFLGYTTETVAVTQAAAYTIVLNDDTNLLDEIVVVGYDTQKKVNLTGSVSSISTETMQNRPIVQTSAALQGMAAGVTVTTNSGAPGDDGGTIRVRGIGTFGGSSAAPLVLIDGVEGSLDSVDPTQIDKISVLKDAASSAIYGSRAANGVILVTTKRGQKGQRSVTYRGYAGWQEPTRLVKNVDAIGYMQLSREESENDGSDSIYTDEYIARYLENNRIDPDSYPITDWQKAALTGSGFTHNHNVTLTASGDKIRVMTSIGYLKQKGIINNTGYYRYNVRNNIDIELNKKLHMQFDVSGMYGHRDRNRYQSSYFNYMNTRDPLILTQYSTDYFAAMSGSSTNFLATYNNEGGNYKNDTYRLNGALTLTWDPTDWLTVEGKAAPRFVMTEGHTYTKILKYYTDAFGTLAASSNVNFGSLTENCNRSIYNNFYGTVKFHKTWNKVHNFSALLGASYEDFSQKTLSAYRQEYPCPDYETINAGADNEYKSNSGAMYQWALGSFFGRINYNYKERYLFEANVRYDGSSRFNAKNRWGVFPSFSGAWRITEEPWMQAIKNTLTEAKLRVSYGQLGNQNISDDYYPTVQTLNIGSSISVNGIVTPIATLTTLANEDITWETSKMCDVGVDFSLWNKLSFIGDVYHKRTEGILMTLSIPSSIGLSAPYQNAGNVTNFGWESAISYHDQKADWRWGVDANLSDVYNKITKMANPSKSTYSVNQEGSEINSIYGLQCLGIIRSQEQADEINATCKQYETVKPGDLYYADIAGAFDENGNPIPDGKVNDDDRTVIGSTIPRYTYGLTLNLGWKGFDLSAFFQGVGKVNSMLASYYIWPAYQGGTYRIEYLDRFNPKDETTWATATMPRLTRTGIQNYRSSSFWMGDASYCRLKNLQLSYTFPKKMMQKAKIQNLMLFANAQNMFTWTKFYQGFDPEITHTGENDGVQLGTDAAANYPQVRTFTFGLEIKF